MASLPAAQLACSRALATLHHGSRRALASPRLRVTALVGRGGESFHGDTEADLFEPGSMARRTNRRGHSSSAPPSTAWPLSRRRVAGEMRGGVTHVLSLNCYRCPVTAPWFLHEDQAIDSYKHSHTLALCTQAISRRSRAGAWKAHRLGEAHDAWKRDLPFRRKCEAFPEAHEAPGRK